MPNEKHERDLHREGEIGLMSRLAIKNHLFISCRIFHDGVLFVVWMRHCRKIDPIPPYKYDAIGGRTLVSIVQSSRKHDAIQTDNHNFDCDQENPAMD